MEDSESHIQQGFTVLSLRLPSALAEELRKTARQADRSLSAEIRYAARRHVEQLTVEEVSGSE